ncbi:Ubiquitin-conjugating enzyme E2 35 [Verticillium dahliae VDG1]|nr:Ubiquitin-conjugating enzyme E2 35 [Verticillium dahliae VDG1]
MATSGFLKSLRRRSKASIRTTEPSADRSGDQYNTDSSSDASRNTVPTTGSITPPSTHGSDPALDQQLKNINPNARPSPQPLPASSRYSVSGMSGLGSPVLNGKSNLPVSHYAPRIVNAPNNAHVYQKFFCVYGTIGDPSQHTIEGVVTVTREDDQFPPTEWKVCDSHWKAVIYLQPGPNRLRFDFSSPKLSNSSNSNRLHSTYLTINMTPPYNAPLQLAVLLAKDSPETFDSVPARIAVEGNGLDAAVRKYRMAAYLWHAFTGEQMVRQKMGPRSFGFEEEWTGSTSHQQDRMQGKMRREARVHIIRSEKTVAELRELQSAQQTTEGANENGLFHVAAEAVNDYFKPLPGQKQYVSVLLLDAHWDKAAGAVTGHVAHGGSVGDLNLAVFGSQFLQSYPSSLDEVGDSFLDCTRLDADAVSSEAGSSWEAANAGLGGHLKEIGRMFGCTERESGIMSNDFLTFGRSFVARESFSTRTKSKGGLVLSKDECSWHFLDCLRFRWHPCFRLPNDRPCHVDESMNAFPIEGNQIVLTAKTGVVAIEILGEGETVCHHWIDYGTREGLPKQQVISELQIRERLPEAIRKGHVRLRALSGGGGSLMIDDLKRLCSKESSLKLTGPLAPGPLSRTAYRSLPVGSPAREGSEAQEVVIQREGRLLLRVVVYHDPTTVHGIEFIYEDASTQLLGTRAGKEGGDTFSFDIRRGEYITGFHIRAGESIQGLAIITSLGEMSLVYGNPQGGHMTNLLCPTGYTVCGVSGSSSSQLDSLGLIIVRAVTNGSLKEGGDVSTPAQDKQKLLLSSETGHFSLIRAMHLADLITLCNGACGTLSIFTSLSYCLGDPADLSTMYLALFFLPFGLFFDFMDGKVARWRKKSSLMGQELDSLADLISFGVAPASAAYALGLRTPLDRLLLTFFLPLGTLFAGSFLEFHPVALLFVVHGCLMTSRRIRIPKP